MSWHLWLACAAELPVCPERMKWKESVPLDGHRTGWCEGASGARNGPYLEWNEDGRLVVSGFYWRNQRSGWWRRWRDDGSLSEETPYTAGKAHGPVRTYDASGEHATERWHDRGDPVDGPLPSVLVSGQAPR